MDAQLDPKTIVRMAFLLACTIAMGFVCPQTRGAEFNLPTTVTGGDVRVWIADLGSSSFKARETASQKLTAAGARAMLAGGGNQRSLACDTGCTKHPQASDGPREMQAVQEKDEAKGRSDAQPGKA